MFLDEVTSILLDLSPPIEAFGIGGSVGAGSSDDLADLDFFVLVPTSHFERFVADFTSFITHPKSLIASRIRGFTAFFGYQFTFIYDDCSSIDYFINCPLTLQPTPMARKTRVLHDATGYFTAFHQNLPGRTSQELLHLKNTIVELLWEAIRIQKYVKRDDLVPLVHRLERIRLVVLALERYLHHQEYFVPHDADKWVLRDLGPGMVERLGPTFPPLSQPDIARSYRALWALAMDLLRELDTDGRTDPRVWSLFERFGEDIPAMLDGGHEDAGP